MKASRSMLVIVAACLVVGSRTTAQRGSYVRQVSRALTQLDVASCTDPAWAARTLSVAVVVFEDRSLSIAVRPVVERSDELGQCLERALRTRLGTMRTGAAPRRPSLVTRQVRLPANDALREAASAALASRVEDCLLRSADRQERRIEGRVRVQVSQGQVRAEGVSGSPAAARCVMQVLSSGPRLPDGAAEVEVAARRTRVASNLPRHDGTRGAVCQWGMRDVEQQDPTTFVPEPRACRAGLTCCYSGGIAGMPSTCHRVGPTGCPRYP